MARIRTIKPEFAESESIGKLSREARLLFVLIWTFVDDAGRARASSRLLASRLYPYDDDVLRLIGGWLKELEEGGHIRLYEADGDSYLDIPNWLKHQKIDHPSKSRLPEFRDALASSREPSRDVRASYLGPSTLDLGPAPPSGGEIPGGPEDGGEIQQAFNVWNEAATRNPRWPMAHTLSEPRGTALAARLRDAGGIEGFRAVLATAEQSQFIRNEMKGWSLDWLLKAANWVKTAEGNYNRSSPSAEAARQPMQI